MKILESKASEVKGVVQILHGMHEHYGRYENIAEFLVNNGYNVVLSNHPHHGEKAFKNGTIGEVRDSLDTFVEKQKNITQEIRKKYPSLPIYTVAHSMGSFIAQAGMKDKESCCDGYILIGSCGKREIVKFGKYIFRILSKIFNKDSKVYQILVFHNGKKDWLTRDKDILEKFMKDPLCTFTYIPEFFSRLTEFLDRLYIEDSFKDVPRELPIYIISGDKDLVGLKGRGVKRLYLFYKNMGFKNIDMKLYKDCGHELLNEINRDEIYNDLLSKLDVWASEKSSCNF